MLGKIGNITRVAQTVATGMPSVLIWRSSALRSCNDNVISIYLQKDPFISNTRFFNVLLNCIFPLNEKCNAVSGKFELRRSNLLYLFLLELVTKRIQDSGIQLSVILDFLAPWILKMPQPLSEMILIFLLKI